MSGEPILDRRNQDVFVVVVLEVLLSLLVSPLATILLRNRLCALPNLVLSTARNRLTTKYGPKNTSSTKYGTAVSAPASITRYITCAQPASVAH